MEYQEFIKKLGKKIKSLREAKGLTQENMDEGDFAISYRTIQDIESGRSHASVRSLYKIAKQLKVKPKDLLDV